MKLLNFYHICELENNSKSDSKSLQASVVKYFQLWRVQTIMFVVYIFLRGDAQ